jgi:hypothetical protein
MLTPQEAQALGEALVKLVEERGLGAVSKKDYELLVFHHLTDGTALRQDGNYHLANKLKVTETRVKAMRLESSIRHRPANHEAVLGQIVQRIIDAASRPDFGGGEVAITLENPIDRREFEHAVKRAQHNVEYGINREILKISPIALFEVILANVEHAEARFKDVVQTCITTNNRQQEILNNSLTLRQRINKLGEEVSANGGAVAMLTAAAGLL